MLRHNNTNQLYRHWAEKRRDSEPPLRHDIQPAAIASSLGNCALLEKQADGTYLFRLAGSRLCSIYGKELTATPIAQLFTPNEERMICQGFDAVAVEHAAMIIETAGFTQKGRVVAFEAVFLPVIDDQPTLISVIQNLTTPTWLGSEPIIAMETRSLRMMDLDRELFALANRPAAKLPHFRFDRSLLSLNTHKTEPSLSLISGHGAAKTRRSTPQLRVLDGGKA